MRCLIIDNYDSFTWNLADYVAQIYGNEPLVIHNDQYTWDEIQQLGEFGSIIVSPGPGSVTNASDFRVSRQALEQNDIPVLGVCLGFQGLSHIYGGEIVHAPVPYHGRKSNIVHNDNVGLFKELPNTFEAVRYHSLVVAADTVPKDLNVTARSECGLIMGVEHKFLPKWGVQFHPESILTEYGMQLVENFKLLSYKHANIEESDTKKSPVSVSKEIARRSKVKKQLFFRKVDIPVSDEQVFRSMFAEERNSFWLDSQSVRRGMSRFSFMGKVIPEDVLTYKITEDSEDFSGGLAFLKNLECALEAVDVASHEDLPFEFRGGYVGYMSYEMKTLFGAETRHRNKIPDAVWMRVEKFVAFDHLDKSVWLVYAATKEEQAKADAWIDEMEEQLRLVSVDASAGQGLGIEQASIDMDMSRECYLDAIEKSKEKIVDGESYEICLTNQFSCDIELDPVELYMIMRKENPAPFGALISIGKVRILSTSPERFLKVDENGRVETKPIKGTCARSEDPATDAENARVLAASEKDQAENLMIVDLMRNDLGRVSVPGSVIVSKMMDIESYQTVHQMVSTVESYLKSECTLVELLKAVYPGGSITGAPKYRSMEIIDQLEQDSRGVYCGTIGYLGYNRIADLNIAIRTLSYDGQTIKFGAGGAITYLSDPSSEYEEIILKAEAVLKPIWQYLSELGTPYEYSVVDKNLSVSACLKQLGSEVDLV
ncbi:aminodeoxychorismate synthase component I [Endozoicomonas sp. SM1973]|uniref:aminodeoxychorismate synthase n=1 Tax=Spartinivicinus marinus TaxID=2994442 RepID=A0A853I9S3_9GAMM|nr:aminodeoxychorismate synthase component I [Spartinivicinus marinus]MCX4030111.1 aminodeoxychorismate synthase component I [Spartinivicinus marinus]NYZ69649.1 aminodeoxychorismate synthase component I [Spartinivicinus marinus]